ncbi:hypothetical protein BN1708_009354, partial [Verticillium longisporum]
LSPSYHHGLGRPGWPYVYATSHQQEQQQTPNARPTQPERASAQPILSLQVPATVQSGSLWRDPCIGGTLAGHYRVGDYNVDYSAQDSHQVEQSHQQHNFDPSPHQHPRTSLHHGGGTSHGLPEPQQGHHQHHHHHHTAMAQHHSHNPHQVLMDPSHMGHPRHMGSSHFAAPGSVVAPLYPAMATPPQVHGQHPSIKRPRPEDLDLSVAPIGDLDHSELDSMQTPLGATYAEASGSMQPPMHHHHRMPDSGPPSKLMRRDGESLGGGGAPSVVGQAGMPAPAMRPRGPKLKFTPEDDQLLIELKENKSLTWKQIADFFPGRSSGTLQVRYCTKLKAKTTQWTDETDQKLQSALQDYESEKWRIVANKVGTGFTPAACRERAQELLEGPL